MTSITTKSDSSQPAAETTSRLFDNWFDPIETEVRARARQFIEELLREELDATLARHGAHRAGGRQGMLYPAPKLPDNISLDNLWLSTRI